jgi:hypothetical protein
MKNPEPQPVKPKVAAPATRTNSVLSIRGIVFALARVRFRSNGRRNKAALTESRGALTGNDRGVYRVESPAVLMARVNEVAEPPGVIVAGVKTAVAPAVRVRIRESI